MEFKEKLAQFKGILYQFKRGDLAFQEAAVQLKDLGFKDFQIQLALTKAEKE